MARSRKQEDVLDAERLGALRGHLAAAESLMNALSKQVSLANRAVMAEGIEMAERRAKKAHQSALFGATGELLHEED